MNRKKVLKLLVFFLSSRSSDENLRVNFADYYQEQIKNYTFTTTSNTELIIVGLYKEDSTENPKVILNIGIGESHEKTYQWLQLSPEERKVDLRECADLVINYAKDNNWSNDYYLYIQAVEVYDGCNIVYDYENDTIWIPNCENKFIEMYEKFGTFYKKELKESQNGIDFLVENELAYIKHNQVEYRNIFSYTVYISDGEFKSYGEDYSTKY